MGSWNAVRALSVLVGAWLVFLFSLMTSNVRVEAGGWPTQKILASVVRIQIDKDGVAMSCSAFAALPNCRLASAYHCIDGAVTINTIPLDVIEANPAEDLALLQARTEDCAMPHLELGREPKQGDATMAAGFPMKSVRPMVIPSVFQGVFDAWGDQSNFAVFVGNTMPGMSGGPIVNTRGEVVSVVLGGGTPSAVYQNMGFGATHAALRKLLMRHRQN